MLILEYNLICITINIEKEVCVLFDFSVIFDVGVVALRILMPIYAIFIVYQCYAAMRRRRRSEKPLVTLVNTQTYEKTPVVFWENSIGRSKANDITVNDPTVSRNHCVLLRRNEGWFVRDMNSTAGTYVNGEPAFERTRVLIDDVISVGNTKLQLLRGDEYDEEVQSSRFFKKVSNKPAIKAWKLMLMVTLFHLFMGIEAMFWNDGTDVYAPIVLFGVLAAVEWGFFSISYFALRRVNFELEALALFLTGIGVMLMVRQDLRSAYVQLIAATIGMALFCVIIKLIENPDKLINKRLRMTVMAVAVGLLLATILYGMVFHTKYGAANWISIGPISFQPSEIVKVMYIFVGASSLDVLQTKRNLIEFTVFSAICVALLAVSSDFGTALIIFVTFLLIIFMRSGDILTVIVPTGAVVGGVFLIQLVAPIIGFQEKIEYVFKRFKAYRHVWEYAQDTGYQQVRVLTFVASGGLFGVGVGNGFLKQYFASESDLVFGILAEEMGVILAITLALAVALLVIYGRAIATRSRSTFYSISACCAAGLLVVQLSLNVFGATDVLPMTGVTFPFVSYGGSSIISCWGLIAFIKAADERTYSLKR